MFAYILMGLSVLLGFAKVGIALSDAFRHEVELPDRVHYFYNFYVAESCNNLQ